MLSESREKNGLEGACSFDETHRPGAQGPVMKSDIRVSMTCIFLLMCGLPQCLAQRVRNQTTYCDDGGPSVFALNADSLPKAVIDSVMNSAESKQVLADSDQRGADVSPEKILRGARIRLSTEGTTEFLVVGSAPLSAADASWFWIVRKNGARASVLLWAAGNCIEAKSSKTLGYRDIEVLWASAGSVRTNTYHYDGKAYRLAHSQLQDRGHND